jgi:predicted MFS family arabinose efflux permease
VAIPVIGHTNDWTETFMVVPVLGLLIFALAWIHFASARTAALTWLDGLTR